MFTAISNAGMCWIVLLEYHVIGFRHSAFGITKGKTTSVPAMRSESTLFQDNFDVCQGG